jgi:hypothetical protein
MPCRCDGYEISDSERIGNLGEKIKHLDGQLCNARSLTPELIEYEKVRKWSGILPQYGSSPALMLGVK